VVGKEVSSLRRTVRTMSHACLPPLIRGRQEARRRISSTEGDVGGKMAFSMRRRRRTGRWHAWCLALSRSSHSPRARDVGSCTCAFRTFDPLSGRFCACSRAEVCRNPGPCLTVAYLSGHDCADRNEVLGGTLGKCGCFAEGVLTFQLRTSAAH
jgi:hypothetical protein